MLSFYTHLVARLRNDEKGATAVEYGIMVALIAVVIIAGVTVLGTTINDLFTGIANNGLPDAPAAPAQNT